MGTFVASFTVITIEYTMPQMEETVKKAGHPETELLILMRTIKSEY